MNDRQTIARPLKTNLKNAGIALAWVMTPIAIIAAIGDPQSFVQLILEIAVAVVSVACIGVYMIVLGRRENRERRMRRGLCLKSSSNKTSA